MSERAPKPSLEPEGKSENSLDKDVTEVLGGRDGEGKWSEVIENQELQVSYREKIIVLPKHRQEETGITRIRRREVLTYPEGFYRFGEKADIDDLITKSRKTDEKGEQEIEEVIDLPSYSSDRKFDDVYMFLTDGKYPSSNKMVHAIEVEFGYPWTVHTRAFENVAKHKAEKLYFQEAFMERRDNIYVGTYKRTEHGISPETKEEKKSKKGLIAKDELAFSQLFCGAGRIWSVKNYSTPVFVFGNKNKAFNSYVDTVLANPETKKMIEPIYQQNIDALKALRAGEDFTGDFREYRLPSVRHPDVPRLRWCHAELALVPTKKNLNVLFLLESTI